MAILRTLDFNSGVNADYYDFKDFEPGGTDPDVLGNHWVVPPTAYEGARSIFMYRFGPAIFANASWYGLNLGSVVNNFWMEFYYRQYPTYASHDLQMWAYFGNVGLCTLGPSRKFGLNFSGGALSGNTFVYDTWYKLTLNVGNGRAKLWVDGNLEIDANYGGSQSAQFRYGNSSGVMVDGAAYYLDMLRLADAPFTESGVAYWVAYRLAVS